MNVSRALALAALAGLAVAAPVRGQDAAIATVPFTFVDNRMMIECTIDGKGPFVMALDTGSSGTVITPETAQRIGVAVAENGTTYGAGEGTVKNGATKLAKLELGSRTFRNLDASVLDLTEIRTKLKFPHFDGIIGYPILKRFATFVDVDAGTISFEAVTPEVPGGVEATTTAFTGTLPRIAAKIDGIATTVMVDTGDRSSLTLFGPFAKAHGFYGRYASQPNIVTGYGVGGPVYGDVFTLPSLDVLGAHLENVVARASRQSAGAFTSAEDGGSIGEGVLKRFNIIYDYPNGRMIAWPSNQRNVPDTFVVPPTRVQKKDVRVEGEIPVDGR
jgi:predicted aspartyl protease